MLPCFAGAPFASSSFAGGSPSVILNPDIDIAYRWVKYKKKKKPLPPIIFPRVKKPLFGPDEVDDDFEEIQDLPELKHFFMPLPPPIQAGIPALAVPPPPFRMAQQHEIDRDYLDIMQLLANYN